MIRLLIVDDSKMNRAFARDMIVKNDISCEIDMSEDGEDALNKIRQGSFDLVLLDIIMPHVSGLEVLEKLSLDNASYMPRFIMLSNIDDLDIIKKCFDLGAMDYIRKPFEEVEFTARVKSMIREITQDKERLNNLEVIAEQNAALIEVNNSLKEAQYYLLQKEKLVAIGELAAGIAHEINNPLAFVISNFEMLKQYISDIQPVLNHTKSAIEDEGKVDEYLTAIGNLWKENDIDYILEDLNEIFIDSQKGLKRVSKIVHSMRNFARISEDEVYEYINIDEIIEETLLIVNNEIKYVANIDKKIETGPLVYCNKGQIEQVLVNVLVNAAHAIKSKAYETLGQIEIAVYYTDLYCEIHIKDNGTGIEKSYLNRIFEPFFTTKPVGQGTGLGLSISYDIVVNKHKGILDVKSVLGEGSEFTVKLPVIMNELGE